MSIALRGAAVVVFMGILAGCGGGNTAIDRNNAAGSGGTGNPGTGNPGTGNPGTGNPGGSGTFLPSSSLAGQCETPEAQKNFLRSWTNELYLWYGEVTDVSPNGTQTVSAYFDLMKTTALTASGTRKDQFHFTYDTKAWEALSQDGVEPGYGAQWILLSTTPPRRAVVAYIEPGSPAATAGLARGDEVLTADGVDVVSSSNVDALNNAFFPTDVGESHTFQLRSVAGVTSTVTLLSDEIVKAPVQNVTVIPTGSGPVGYLLFNDHILTSESALINAINNLKAQNVVDLVLDVRYNGGGYLGIASELSYMIAGTQTAGRTFEKLTFNDKHPNTNPVSGDPLAPIPFADKRVFNSPGVPLPTLNLSRVYIITGNNTCSASESIINSLRGIDVAVYQIGSTTCGKPYGFYPKGNCGTTYFSIQFKNSNEKNFGDYSDGFSPQNTVSALGTSVPGCSVADDFTKELGDATERRLAAVLNFRSSNNQTCPTPSGFAAGVQTKPRQPLSAADGVMYKSPWRENRILVE